MDEDGRKDLEEGNLGNKKVEEKNHIPSKQAVKNKNLVYQTS